MLKWIVVPMMDDENNPDKVSPVLLVEGTEEANRVAEEIASQGHAAIRYRGDLPSPFEDMTNTLAAVSPIPDGAAILHNPTK